MATTMQCTEEEPQAYQINDKLLETEVNHAGEAVDGQDRIDTSYINSSFAHYLDIVIFSI